MPGAPVGFFGKVPSHGDFIARRVDGVFLEKWDEWLQRSISESQRALGGAWLDCYLTGPLWRFFLCEGIAGPACFAGVLTPSVDRVGRYFPLTVVVQLPTDLEPLTFANAARGWFESVERICVHALQATNFDLAWFDAELEASGATLAPAGSAAKANTFHGGAYQWRWAVGHIEDIHGALGKALISQAQDELRPMSMWWTDGSEHVRPSVLVARNLPRPESFAALLDGGWERGGWYGDVMPVAENLPPYEPLQDAHFEIESAGATDCGAVRAENQDCYTLHDGNRLWAVADGMGGHRDGAVASRMVSDALHSLEPTASVNSALESVRIALERVNTDLRRSALTGGAEATSGSTVVVLAVRGAQYAICWAGDSRAYLYRDGALTRMTQDHVDTPVVAGAGADTPALIARGSAEITRAVGGDDILELDHMVDSLLPGDRFLLCSDGLYVALDSSVLGSCLQLPRPQEAADKLIEEANRAGAADNVTAVVVDVRSDRPA